MPEAPPRSPTEPPLSVCSTLADHLDLAAARWPDLEAVIYGPERPTFSGLASRSVTVARALRALRVGPGDAVGLLMRNSVDNLAAVYGTARLGAVPVPINGRLKARELAYIIAHADLRVLIASESLPGILDYAPLLHQALPGLPERHPGSLELPEAPALRQAVMLGAAPPSFLPWEDFLARGGEVTAKEITALQSRVRVRDVGMLMYTSGTTANPKGCLLSHETLVRAGRVFGLERFPMVAGDRQFNPLPLFHMATILPFNGCLAAGATFVGMEHFDAGAALRLMEAERCTVAFPAFDLIWAGMLDHPDFPATDLSRLRLVNSNGVPEHLAQLAQRTPWLTLISPYGATEGGGVIALSHLDDPLELRLRSAGRPFAGVEVRIVDPETGAVVPAGARGEITYRGWSMFDGYHKDADATAAAYDADGYFHSGDLGSVDGDGRLTYVGRLKDVLKVGGENVAAAELEGFLGEHPDVDIVQVVGAPDLRYNEVPCAYVQPRPGAAVTERELIDWCVGRLASFKVPRYIRFVTEWPMSGTKIQKFRLREMIAAELEPEEAVFDGR